MKRLAVWAVLVALLVVLFAGAIVRTWDRVAGAGESHGEAHGQSVAAGSTGHAGQAGARNDGSESGRGNGSGEGIGRQGDTANGGRQGGGQGEEKRGQERAGSGANGSGQAAEEPIDEWLEYEGVVVSVDDSVIEVETATGLTVVVEGRPRQYVMEQEAQVELGDTLLLTGFNEDGEFKAATLQDLESGEEVVLRDDTGRPMWAGQGRRQQASGTD